jgi:SAM-dependent methyltransferase
MYTDPYKGIYPAIVDVLEDLILPEDTYHQTHKRRIARTLQVFLDQSPEGIALELGTGGVVPLALSVLAPDLEIRVTNFDLSQTLYHKVRPSLGKHEKEFQAYAIDLESDVVPEPTDTFDWVLCCEVIEHMEIDPMFMMCEINRVLKPDGGLLITTPNVVSSRGLTKMVTGIEPYFYMQYRKDRSFYRHNYEYSIHSLMKVLKAAGFDGTIWTEDNFEDSMPSVVERLSQAGFNITHTGDNIISVAKRVSNVVERYPAAIYAD